MQFYSIVCVLFLDDPLDSGYLSISGVATPDPPLVRPKQQVSATKDTAVEEASGSSSGRGLQGVIPDLSRSPLKRSEYLHEYWRCMYSH